MPKETLRVMLKGTPKVLQKVIMMCPRNIDP